MRSPTDTAEVEYDAGDRVSVAEKAKRAKAREERRVNGLRQIMSSSDGRVWMWEFLSACGLFRSDFNGNSRDYYQLGMRNIGMPTFAELQKNHMDQYILMVKENA
jgi:hypothetical protein